MAGRNERKGSARRPATRAPSLQARVGSLEGRMGQLNRRVSRLEEIVGVGATEAKGGEAEAEGPRCPGCNLPVEEPAASRCVWCGFVFSAAPSFRARRRRRKG